MARLPLLEKPDLEPIALEVYEKFDTAGTEVLNLFKVLAHSPKILRDWNRLGTTLLHKGQLSPALRELAIIRVGELAQADYELTAHRRIGLTAGLSRQQVEAIASWESADCFDETERLVLRFTDEVALGIRASAATFAAARAVFSDEELVELTVNIGYYGMVVRFLETMEVDAQPD